MKTPTRRLKAVSALLLAALLSFTTSLSVAADVAHVVVAQAPMAPALPQTALRYQWDILHNNDTFSASQLLEDPGAQAWFVENKPAIAGEVLSHALLLKDLQDMLQTYQDPDDLRLALLKRHEQSWRTLDALTQRSPALKQRIAFVRWDWSTLPKGTQEWLEKEHQITPEMWDKLDVENRQINLRQWANGALNEFQSAVPKSREELQRMEDLKKRIWATLHASERYEIDDQMQKARTAVRTLTRAEARLKTADDPKWAALAREARTAQDLDQMLASLGTLFDGMGIRDGDLIALRPDLPHEELTGPQSLRLEKRLTEAFARELPGTLAGNKVHDFYNSGHPLGFSITSQISKHWLGSYSAWTDAIDFNVRFIVQFLKVRGFQPKDLWTDKDVFRQLVQPMAPLWVHETTHRMQHVWARTLGIQDLLGCQLTELEACLFQCLHALEKMQADPAYKQSLGLDIPGEELSQRTLRHARHLKPNVMEFKKHVVSSDVYLSYPSIEAAMSPVYYAIQYVAQRHLRPIYAELRRRALLPRTERARLEKKLGNAVAFWSGGIRDAKTRVLRREARHHFAPAAYMMKSYALWRQRLKSAFTEAGQRLVQLSASTTAGKLP